jgi:hypothetical protein
MQEDSRTGSSPKGYAGSKWKRQGSSTAESAKSALDAASVTIKDRARNVAEQQKEAGADQIGGVARAVHGAAREIEQEMPQAAGLIHDAATRLEDAAVSLRERSSQAHMRRQARRGDRSSVPAMKRKYRKKLAFIGSEVCQNTIIHGVPPGRRVFLFFSLKSPAN